MVYSNMCNIFVQYKLFAIDLSIPVGRIGACLPSDTLL